MSSAAFLVLPMAAIAALAKAALHVEMRLAASEKTSSCRGIRQVGAPLRPLPRRRREPALPPDGEGTGIGSPLVPLAASRSGCARRERTIFHHNGNGPPTSAPPVPANAAKWAPPPLLPTLRGGWR